jgi:hypothetical protein
MGRPRSPAKRGILRASGQACDDFRAARYTEATIQGKTELLRELSPSWELILRLNLIVLSLRGRVSSSTPEVSILKAEAPRCRRKF